MRRYRPFTLAIVALLAAACAAAPGASTGQDSSPEASNPTGSASEEPTATPDESAGAACSVGGTPDLTTGWTFLEGLGASYGLAYPEHWEDLSGEGEFTASTLLDEETFAELGRDSDATIRADFVRAPTGLPNLSVFVFGAVASSVEEIRDREVARYAELEDIERIVDPSIDGCLGGTPAPGLSLEFRSTDGNLYHQQNLFAVRDGELYVVQWLDTLDTHLDLLASILSTWDWTLDSGGSGSGGIAEANMATEVDSSLDTPDPSTYSSTFTTDASAIYVVLRGDDGAEGTVELTWLFEGDVVFEASLEMAADTPWAWGGITPPGGGFQPGNYEVRLELNGDVETVPFTVEAP